MLDFLKGKALGLLDRVAVAFSPYDKFSRAAKIVDKSSLKEKADNYFSLIQKRHLYGKACEFYWNIRATKYSPYPPDGGDNAIWQGVYAAACAMRGDKSATYRALNGMELLQTLGGDNRLARGADKIGGQMGKDPSKKYYEADGYFYRQDCSESSLIGHVYGLWAVIAFDKAPENVERACKLIDGLAAQLITDGYRMLNQDGTTAKYGDLRPNWKAAPVRIAALCATLLLAYKATGKGEYKRHYEKIATKHKGCFAHLETKIVLPFFVQDAGYDDFLVYMLSLVLISSEHENPELLLAYKQGLNNQWRKNKEEGNSFYTFTHWFLTRSTDERHLRNAVQMLNEFNTDPRPGAPSGKEAIERKNSDNDDIDKVWIGLGKRRKYMAKQPLPVWQRPGSDFVWQRNPYTLDGWVGHKNPEYTFNGLDYCAAYYLGTKGGVWK